MACVVKSSAIMYIIFGFLAGFVLLDLQDVNKMTQLIKILMELSVLFFMG